MELELESTSSGLRIGGEMTVYSAAELKRAFLSELATQRTTLDLDLTRIVEFDTAGLQVLLMLQRQAVLVARELRIVGCSQVVRAALELCHQEHLLGNATATEAAT